MPCLPGSRGTTARHLARRMGGVPGSEGCHGAEVASGVQGPSAGVLSVGLQE